jgi:hypothetical protein
MRTGFVGSRPSRKNKGAVRVGHPVVLVSHPFRGETESMGHRAFRSRADFLESTAGCGQFDLNFETATGAIGGADFSAMQFNYARCDR